MLSQTALPAEIIFVDGGSADDTLEVIIGFFKSLKEIPGFKSVTVLEDTGGDKNLNIDCCCESIVFESVLNDVTRVKIYSAPGANISCGRNIAINNTSSGYICVSDAGCRLSKNWAEEISRYFTTPGNPDGVNNQESIISGGYNFPYIENFLQACLAVCVLPLKSEINRAKYMPSSRNVSYAKTAWEKAGGYPQNMDFGEDMRFNFNLKASGYNICFNPDALVYWNLRNNAPAIFRQFFRYAKGDAVGRMYPHRHLARFAALVTLVSFILLSVFISPYFLFAILLLFAAFIFRPYFRINGFLNDKNCCVFAENKKMLFFTKLKIIFAIPLMLSFIETAKLAGFIYGLFIREKH